MNPAQDSQINIKNKKLTLSETTRVLGISQTSLRRYETAGKIAAERLQNGYRLFEMDEVNRFKVQLEIERHEYRKRLAMRADNPRKEKNNVQNVQTAGKSTRKGMKNLQKTLAATFLGTIVFTFIASGTIHNKSTVSQVEKYRNSAKLVNNWVQSSIGIKKAASDYRERQNVLSAADRNANFVFNVNNEAFFKQNVNTLKNVSVTGGLSVTQIATLGGGIATNNQNANLGTGQVTAGTVTFTGAGLINNLLAIDATTKATLEKNLDLTGDVESTGLSNTVVSALNGETLGDTTTDEGNVLMAIGSEWVSTSQTEISQLGTVNTGVWNGTAIVPTFGGTGITTYVIGDILYAPDTNTLERLPISTLGYVMTSNGTYPTWQSTTSVLGGSPWLTTGNGGTTAATNFIGTKNNQDLVFKTNDIERLRMDTSGNVGVGTSNPLQILDVMGAIRLGAVGTGNTLNTSVIATAPTGNLFWGNRTLVDSTNVSTYAVTSITAGAGLSGGGTSGVLTLNVGASGGITLNSDDITIDVATAGVSSTTASNSGLEVIADGLKLTGGCANADVLQWDASRQVWYCSVGSISGTGAAGQVTYWDSSSTLSSSSTFTWNDSLGRLGIGTTTPSQTLDVVGAVRLGTPGANNVLNTSATGGAPSGDLFWGNRTLVDSANVTTYATTGVTAGSGLSGGGTVGSLTLNIGAGNGITLNADDITIDAATTGSSATTASNSGLEVVADGIKLLGGCANTEMLTWDTASQVWKCTPPAIGALTGSGLSGQVSYWNGTSSVAGSDSFYWDSGTTRLGLGTTAPSTLLYVNGTATFGQINLSGDSFTDLTGNGLELSGTALTVDATTTGITSTTASNSGLEVTADGLRLVSGCASNEVLAWDSTLLQWRCTSITGVGAVSGSGASGQVSYWTGVNSISGTNNFFWDNGTSRLGIGISAPGSSLTIAPTDAAGIQLNPFGTSIGQTTDLRFLELAANGAEYTGFKSPDSLDQSIIYTMPSTTAPADYVLTVQVDNTLQWKQVSGIGGAGDITAVGSVLSGDAFSDANANNQWLGLGAAAGNIQFFDKATDAIAFNNANVGIGTTGPASKLSVGTNTSVTEAITTQAGLGANAITLQSTVNGAFNSKAGILASWAQSTGVGIASGLVLGRYGSNWGTYIGFHTHPDDTAANDSFIERMRIDGNGNVGIGATNPLFKLDVSGAIRLGADGGGNILYTSSLGTAPSTDLFWGNRTVVDSANVSTYATTGVTAGSGLTGGGTVGALTLNIGSGNGVTVNSDDITVDTATTGITSTTASNSGIEVTADGIRLIGGCTNNEVLSWDATLQTWKCSPGPSLTGAGSAGQVSYWDSGTNITGSDSFFWDGALSRLGIGTTAPITTLDVVGAIRLGTAGANNILDTASSGNAPTGDLFWGNRILVDSANVTTYATTGVTAGSGLTGGGTTGVLTLDIGAGNGITVNANDITIDAATAGITSTTASNSGLELAADGLRMLGGCVSNEVLSWDATLAVWRCIAVSGANSLIGTGNANQVAFWNNPTTLTGSDSLYWDNALSKLGIGTTSPISMLSVGDSSQFQVNSTGNIVLLNNVIASFPSSQGVANSMLKNDGSGILSWADPTSTGVFGYWNRTDTTLFPTISTDNIGTLGNMGVGTTSPLNRMDVSGNMVIGTYAGVSTAPINGLLVSGRTGLGTTAPAYQLDVAGVARAYDIATQELIFANSSANILSAYAGYDAFTNFTGGIGTGGKDSLLATQRITSQGNLVNIGSIQAGEMLLTSGGTFGAAATYPSSGVGPYSVSTADFNGDGKADIAYVNNSGNSVGVMLNSGTGTFGAATTYPSRGAGPQGISTADFNGDGKADIAYVNNSGNSVGVMLNSGSGTFGAATTYPSRGAGPQGISAADLNGDGKADLSYVNISSDSVGVMLNSGSGTFGAATTYPSRGTSPYSVSTADFNGDGKADLSYVNINSDSVGVMLNSGNGTFGAATTYPSNEATPLGILAADLNGDGKADIAYVNYNANSVGVLTNSGSGTFGAATTYPSSGVGPQGMSAADLNGDGKADLSYVNYTSNSVGVMINSGSGTFGAATTYPSRGVGPYSVSTADFNGDGKADIAYVNNGGNSVGVMLNTATTMLFAQASTGNVGIGTTAPSQAKLSVAGNAAIGSFSASTTAPINGLLVSGRTGLGTTAPAYQLDVAGVARAYDIATQELIFANSSANILSAYAGYDAFTNFTGGIGTGGKDSLLATQRITSQGNLVNIGSIQAGEMLLTSGGTFGAATTYPSRGAAPVGMSVADLNGDGKADLSYVNYTSNSVGVMLNSGTGTFGAATTYPSNGVEPYSVSTADFNGDGKADLSYVNYTSNSVGVMINSGSGTFGTATTYPSRGTTPVGVSAADLNGDGKADLSYVNNTTNSVGVMLNSGSGTFGAATTYPSRGTGPYSVSVADLNGDGKADLSYVNYGTNSVGVMLNSGSGTFGAATTYPSSGVGPQGMSAADLNGDGKADLSYVNYTSNSVGVMINSGSGTFGAATTYPAYGTTLLGVSAADLNGDGKADLSYVNYGTNSVGVMINSGSGTFGAATTYPSSGAGPVGVSAADLNGDGKADLSYVNYTTNSVGVMLNTATTMLFAQASTGNVGIGTIAPASKLSVGGIGYANTGVYGEGLSYGVRGTGSGVGGIGVRGTGSGVGGVGVYGSGGEYGVTGEGSQYGVYAFGPIGVYGEGFQYGVLGYGETYNFYASGPGTNYGPFTGSHEVILTNNFMETAKPGMIVSTTGQVKKREGSLSSTLPTVKLTDTANSNTVFGVYTMIADLPATHWYKPQAGEQTAVVNALGDGSVWVTNYAGEIKNGDRIISSPIAGYGMKEDGRYSQAYIVAKITEDIDWATVTNTVEYGGEIYKVYLASGIYDTLTITSALDSNSGTNYFGGNVGIGDIAPDALLDVHGTVCLDLNADDVCTDNTSALSDARLKTNITDLTNALDLVNSLHAVRFNWNGLNNTGTAASLGFIAQEVETIFPELVITDTAGFKNLDYSKLTAVLAGAIQEQQVQIAPLSGQIASLSQSTTEISNLSLQLTDLNSQVTTLSSDLMNMQDQLEQQILTTSSLQSLQTDVTFIKELLGLSESSESTQSTETSQSSSSQNMFLSSLQALISNATEEFNSMIAALGLSNDGNTLTVSSDMNVLGDATLNSVVVTGDLAVGQLKMDGSANSLAITGPACYNADTQTKNTELCDAQTMYIQKGLAGNIDIFNGKVVIQPDGVLLVNGTIKTTKVTADEYAVTQASQMTGEAVLGANSHFVTISNPNIKIDSKVFVTPTSSTNGQSLIVSEKVAGTSFTVSLDNTFNQDIDFDWWILNVE